MKIIDKIIFELKKDENKKNIALPEALDKRVLEAASIILKENFANIFLIGNEIKIKSLAKENDIDISKAEIINPKTYYKKDELISSFYELRRHKGITIEDARKILEDEVYFGVMLVHENICDGLVSGAIHSTADTLRPALQIIKAKDKTKKVSSFMLMELEESNYKDIYVFSDCGLIENPESEDLAQIAQDANDSYINLVGKNPKVAMLSYSTGSNLDNSTVLKINKALELLKNKKTSIIIDGPLQLDAAIDKDVANLKAPKSIIAGDADVLVFPDLNSGNIGYKLVERLAKAKAYGPITQGMKKPINDLSRGCNSFDIVGAVAITCKQVKS